MPLSDDLVKRTRKSVKNYKDKVRILKKKGVSSSAFQRIGTPTDFLKAYKDNPRALRRRLDELDNFSTKGKVFKTESGMSLTKTVKTFKNREIRRARLREENLYTKAKSERLSNIDLRSRKLNKLNTKIQDITRSQASILNYSITTPEQAILQKRTGVENFMKALNFGLGGMDNTLYHDPNLEKRLRNRLSKLTEDELDDLLQNNNTVKSIMNYYREKEHDWVEFSGGTLDERLEQLDNELPNIITRYKAHRK